ncbi:hypothetical protein JOB18_025509 [Solea senegalensis]|uniref:Uncharacterized protein n=1 Tax=Solea senegalensis TaxID=28829 RepID=A0AAV6Q6C9_SOLSE|nr:hypothetical protein JOB18_025509 [Solea senegalensis]
MKNLSILSLESRALLSSASLLPHVLSDEVEQFILPVSFPSCSPLLSLPSLPLLFHLILILILIRLLLSTHCCTWLWFVLRYEGNQNWRRSLMLLPQQLIHEDRPGSGFSSGLPTDTRSSPWTLAILKQRKSVMAVDKSNYINSEQ